MFTFKSIEPLSELMGMNKDFNDFVSSTFGAEKCCTESKDFTPPIETLQSNSEFIVRVDLPGVKSSEIDISVTTGTLTIKGERHLRHTDKNKKFFHREPSYGPFFRSLELSDEVDIELVHAKHTDGLLEIRLPIKKEAVAKKIKIEATDTLESRTKN